LRYGSGYGTYNRWADGSSTEAPPSPESDEHHLAWLEVPSLVILILLSRREDVGARLSREVLHGELAAARHLARNAALSSQPGSISDHGLQEDMGHPDLRIYIVSIS
jgi:hypothetical protein